MASIGDELRILARLLTAPAIYAASVGGRYFIVWLGVDMNTAHDAQAIFLGVVMLSYLIFIVVQAVRKSNRSEEAGS